MQKTIVLSLIAVFALGAVCGEIHARYVARVASAGSARPVALGLVREPREPSASGPDSTPYVIGSVTSTEAAAAKKRPNTPESRFNAALAQPDGDARLASLKTSFIQWVSEDPSVALRALDRVPLAYRQELMAPALAALAERQPDKALDYANAASDSSPESLGAVLAVVAKKDPQRALEIASGPTLNTVIAVVAQTNLEMAARFVTAQAERAPTAAIEQIANEYAKRGDPTAAFNWAREATRDRPTAVATAAMNATSASLAATNLEQATSYLNQTSDTQIRNSLIREIASRKGEQDLRTAWDWLTQYRNDTAYSENARNLLYRWSYARPEEVAALLREVTDNDVLVAGAKELSSQWQRRDMRGYQTWLTSLPAGPLKAAAIGVTQ